MIETVIGVSVYLGLATTVILTGRAALDRGGTGWTGPTGRDAPGPYPHG